MSIGETVIAEMKARNGSKYGPFVNNCQVMAKELLDKIGLPGHADFFSTVNQYEQSKNAVINDVVKKEVDKQWEYLRNKDLFHPRELL